MWKMLACWFQQTKEVQASSFKNFWVCHRTWGMFASFLPMYWDTRGVRWGSSVIFLFLVVQEIKKSPGISSSRVLPISRRLFVFLEIVRKFLGRGQDTRSSPHSLSAELLRNRMSKTAKILIEFWRKSASCLWLKIYNCNCRWGKASKKVD